LELMSPYRARARQYRFIFVIGLQEGVFPRARTEDPFLAEPERIAAGLPPRADQRDEERFLFYTCITRPVRRLHLSYRSSDEEGAEAVRSFFVDDVLELLAVEVPVIHRGLSDTVFDAADAPAERDVARGLALRGATSPPDALGASEALADRLEAALEPASRRAAYIPGSLSVPYVLEEFRKRDVFGASSLEEYWSCPFRYLVGHELRPWPLEPLPESLTRGSLVHEVLELVYRDRYVGSRPEPGNVEAAIEHARELLAELAPRHQLDPVTPRRLAGYRRIESDIVRFLRWDAEHPLAERVVALEGSFGGREDDEMGALELEGLRLHGKIDRIDAMVDGGALIRDYKTGASVTSRAQMADYGKLQLQLYLLAARRLWNLEPAGGVYHALGSQRADNRPRGILRGPLEASPLGSDDVVKTDFTEGPEDFEAALKAAADKAGELALKIQTGYLRREPIGGSCPRWCDFHTICRMERGEKNPDDDEPRWDQENGDG
jgi:RecB family exonuclease